MTRSRATRGRLAAAMISAGLLLGGTVATVAPNSASADSPTIGAFSVHPAESNSANPLTRAYFIRDVRPGASSAATSWSSTPAPRRSNSSPTPSTA